MGDGSREKKMPNKGPVSPEESQVEGRCNRRSGCEIRQARVISVKSALLNAHASIVGLRDRGWS